MQVQRLTLSSSNFSPRSLSPTFLPAHHLTTKLWMSHPTSTSGFCSSLKWESKSAICLGKPRRLVEIRCGGLNEEGNDDGFYMRKCVELARRAIGCTSPNPMVGCVIVKDGKVVGEGFHPKAGQPHAEVFALRDAGDLAENATAYVSLEPCNHYGKTPPCTEALIKAKVKRVVVGMVDPNPIVASKGVARLKDAGLEVTVGVEEELCKWLNESFIHLMLTGKPFVTLRYSLSVNGHLVDHLGEGTAVSGGYYSQLLQEHDAVILSSASIIDKFQIPASQEPGAKQPLLIVMAYQHSSLIQISGAASAAAAKLVVFSDKEVKIQPEVSKSSIETVVLEHVNLNAILEYCKRQGCCSVLLDLRNKTDDMEELLSQGIEKSLFQKLVFEVLPLWVEGENGNAPIVLKSLRETIEVRKLKAKISDKGFVFEGCL